MYLDMTEHVFVNANGLFSVSRVVVPETPFFTLAWHLAAITWIWIYVEKVRLGLPNLTNLTLCACGF